MPSFKSWPACLSALAPWLALSVRPDLEFVLPDRSLLVDGAVVHPAAPSRRSQAVLAAARDIENAKSAKYREVASERGASFLAFIAESYGAIKLVKS